MALHQKVNHFPGMFELSRKNRLNVNLKLMQASFPREYDFFPKTYVLPEQLPELLAEYNERPEPYTLIVKP